MPVRHLSASSDARTVAESIIKAHPSLLAPHLVSLSQVEGLMRRLIEHRASEARHAAAGSGSSSRAPRKRAARHERDGDIRVSVSAETHLASPLSLRTCVLSAAPPHQQRSAADSAEALGRGETSGAGAEDERDLNKASEDELKAAKAAMERGFERVALKPGDMGYVHDKRVAAPADGELEANDWDDEIEDFDTEDEMPDLGM